MLRLVLPFALTRPLDKKGDPGFHSGFNQEMNKLKGVFAEISRLTTLSERRFVTRLKTRLCTTEPKFPAMPKGRPPEKRVNLF